MQYFGVHAPLSNLAFDDPSINFGIFLHLRHKNIDSVFIKKYKVYFWWEKSPCGSALGRTELREYMFYGFHTQTSRFHNFGTKISYVDKIKKVFATTANLTFG